MQPTLAPNWNLRLPLPGPAHQNASEREGQGRADLYLSRTLDSR
jgi:hypothetical protein